MSDLIINGIDHSAFDLDWAKRGGWCIVRGEVCKLISKATYISSDTDTLFVRAVAERMATPEECRKAGVKHIEPPATWRDIKGAPKNTWVITTDDFYVTEAFFSTPRNEWIMKNGDELSEPTRWMPLPQPPKDE